MTFHLMCVHIILVRFRLLGATFLEIAAHSVDHMFSLLVLRTAFGFRLLQFRIFAYFYFYNGGNLASTLAPSFLIGSSSLLQVTRTTIPPRVSSKFDSIGPRTAERLKKIQ